MGYFLNKSLSVPFNCHFLFRILCRDAIMAPPKKKRKTTESTKTDIPVHVSRPRTPRSTRSLYQRSPATVSLNNNTTPSTDSNIPILAKNNTGTIPNIDYTRLAEEIIRLQNRNTMEEVQPASSSGNFCADSLTANTSSFLASDTEFSSGQLRSQYHNSLTTVPQSIPDNNQLTRNSTSAMSGNNNTPYTDNSQIHTLIENILSTESPATSLTGRELCHGPIVDLSGDPFRCTYFSTYKGKNMEQ